MSSTAERLTLFLEEQARLGRDPDYEIWGDIERPEHPITLRDIRQALILATLRD